MTMTKLTFLKPQTSISYLAWAMSEQPLKLTESANTAKSTSNIKKKRPITSNFIKSSMIISLLTISHTQDAQL